MCDYRKLKASHFGCIIECNRCDRIQVAFGNLVVSYTREGFCELVKTVDMLYREHSQYPFRDEKMICVPTTCRSMTMIYSVNELHSLHQLLQGGRKELTHDPLLVFSKN